MRKISNTREASTFPDWFSQGCVSCWRNHWVPGVTDNPFTLGSKWHQSWGCLRIKCASDLRGHQAALPKAALPTSYLSVSLPDTREGRKGACLLVLGGCRTAWIRQCPDWARPMFCFCWQNSLLKLQALETDLCSAFLTHQEEATQVHAAKEQIPTPTQSLSAEGADAEGKRVCWRWGAKGDWVLGHPHTRAQWLVAPSET